MQQQLLRSDPLNPADEKIRVFYARAHRLMLGCLAAHWLISLGLAARNGSWLLALVVGAPALALPWWMTRAWPTARVTSCVVAMASMVYTALIIQQARGDLEAHFSFFVTMALLVTYFDWLPIVMAIATIGAHHIVWSLLQPAGIGFAVFPDGEPIWQHLLVHVLVALGEGAGVMYLAITMRRLVLEWDRSHQRQLLALAGARLGQWEWQVPQGRYGYDRRWCEILGLEPPPHEITSDLAERQAHPDELDAMRARRRACLAASGGAGYSIERRLRHAEGRWIWVVESGRVIERDARGAALQLAGTIQDITDRKQHEIELGEAKDAAEAANRAKSEFLANMSHEIRTPLNAVLGLTRVVLDGALASRQRSLLTTAHNSSRALLGILNDILDYSKIEAGRMAVEQVPFDLLDTLHGVERLFGAQLEHKGLSLELSVDPALPRRVCADPLRLAQVLNNLVGNAIKFTERGGVRVSAVLAGSCDAGLDLRFEVSDTGCGLCAEQIEQLFRPFTQADGSITRKHGGTGLGLSITRRLVHLMGGELNAAGEPGRGATFAFTVRVGATVEAPPPAPAPSAPAAHSLAGRRILVVEDNEVNQQVAETMLRSRGAEVLLAGHGGEALDILAGAPVDLVLMDLHMPVMGGLEATTRLKQDPRLRALPVVALTACIFDEDRERCRAAGMAGFVAKPVEADDLVRVIADVLARGPARAEHEPSRGEAVLALLAHLEPYLREGELVPEELLAQLRDDALRSAHDSGLAELEARIFDFDHDLALQALRRVERDLGQVPEFS